MLLLLPIPAGLVPSELGKLKNDPAVLRFRQLGAVSWVFEVLNLPMSLKNPAKINPSTPYKLLVAAYIISRQI